MKNLVALSRLGSASLAPTPWLRNSSTKTRESLADSATYSRKLQRATFSATSMEA